MRRKLDNLMWLRMVGFTNYISYRYIFISSFVSLTNYTGQKIEQSNVAMYRGRIHVYIFFGCTLECQLWLRMAGYLNYLSSTCIFISSFVSQTEYGGQKMNNLMCLSMAGEFMSTFCLGTVNWLMSHLLTADNKPGFQ